MDKIYYSDIIYLVSFLITITAQILVSASYSKYKKILNNKDNTGYDTARKILDNNNLEDVMILETKGNLTDHYDPKRKVIKLSAPKKTVRCVDWQFTATLKCMHG